jgi:D-amino-acid dehydrogenase
LLRDLSLASRARFAELAAAGWDFGWEPRGLLMLCRTDEALHEEAHGAEKARALGIPAEVLDAAAVQQAEPGLTMTVRGAVRYPQDGHLQPAKFLAALERELRAAGAEFLFETEGLGWRKEGATLAAVRTTRGEIAADEFVLCGGSWSEGLLRGLDLALPLQAGKGYSLTLPAPPQRMEQCAILTEARVAVTPLGAALRFGGTMEIAGLNESITARRVHGIIKAAAQYFPAFTAEHFAGIEPWRGLRPCSPDGLPYLGRTQAARNLTLATGHAMMGLSLAPITGQIVARLLAGEPPGFDLHLLRPDRFA